MKASKTGLGLLAMIAIFAVPTVAHAEYLVPPGNSAATQYTEAVPTAGGPKATNSPKQGGGKSPKQVLGHHNAAKLEAQGAEGRQVAEVVAATAPGPVDSATGGSGPHHEPSNPESGKGSGGGNSGGGGVSEGGETPGGGSGQAGSPDAALVAQPIPNGSSGLGEVLGQATGSSDSGQLGLLPLIVLATIAWSVAYVLRRRKLPTR